MQQNWVNLTATTILTLELSFIEKEKIFNILDKYAKIILALMIVAIPMGILYLLVPHYDFMHVIYSDRFGAIGGYYNFFIYTENNVQDYRVQSIFWEPGAWAVNQMIAVYWYLAIKKNYKYFYIFLVSILVTLSTTGIVLFALVILDVFIGKSKNKIKREILKTSALLVGLFILVVTFVFSSYNYEIKEYFYLQTVGKFEKGTLTYGSNQERTATFEDAWAKVENNYFLGIGRTTNLYVTSTIAQVLYQTGIPYTILYLFLFLRPFLKMRMLIAIPFVLILLNGEVFGYYGLYTLLIVLGSKSINKINKQ